MIFAWGFVMSSDKKIPLITRKIKDNKTTLGARSTLWATRVARSSPALMSCLWFAFEIKLRAHITANNTQGLAYSIWWKRIVFKSLLGETVKSLGNQWNIQANGTSKISSSRAARFCQLRSNKDTSPSKPLSSCCDEHNQYQYQGKALYHLNSRDKSHFWDLACYTDLLRSFRFGSGFFP